MCTGTNCQVTFARKTGVNFQPLCCFLCPHLSEDWSSKSTKTKYVVYCFRSPVYMMLRLFFTVHNEKYLWWILRVFCFLWLELFSRRSFSFKPGLKVLFPWDLKVSHFQSSNIVSQWGWRHTKDSESKMYSPPCFANSVSQISNNTGSLQHHREVRNGLLQDDIKGAAEKQTGVRVSFQIQTVRISRWISVWRVTWEMKALCGTSFPGRAKFSVRERRAPSTTYNTLTALLSSVM